MYKYLHDIENETVYKVPKSPQVNPKYDRNGEISSYHVSMVYESTCANNQLLNNNTWEQPVSPYVEQLFDDRYDEEQVTAYFFRHHEPKGQSIDEHEYLSLKTRYESLARKNKD